MHILIIGTLPPPNGGSTLLLKQLLDDLACRQDVKPAVINTGGARNGVLSVPGRLIRSVSQALRTMPLADVVTLHLNRPTTALFFVRLARSFDKPVILRFFGGADYRATHGALGRCCVKRAIRQADLTLYETKRLVAMAREDGARRAEWYSNSRRMPPAGEVADSHRTRCRRFVFLGHVNQHKGVPEIIATDQRLLPDVQVDVYGPLTNGFPREAFAGLRSVKYRGEIKPDKVSATLAGYDALLLPTHYSGEGYPGVILEAFAAGIPVITTEWLSIPEVADASCALLVPPQNPQALADAITRLHSDNDLYSRLCAGSVAKRKQFCAQYWTDVFVAYCREVLSHKQVA